MTTNAETTRRSGLLLAVGGALTAITGLLVVVIVAPASDVSDEMWSYPWGSKALVVVSVLYAVLHGLVLAGLRGFARSGIAGTGRGSRLGPQVAIAGTGLLLIAELASIPVADQSLDDTGVVIVGSFFGIANLIAAVGLLIAGVASVQAARWDGWRRFAPLASGLVLTVVLALAMTPFLAAGVGVYGLGILALGIALATEPEGSSARPSSQAIQV